MLETLEGILCSLRSYAVSDSILDCGIGIPALLLLQITRYIIPATSTHNTESALREGEAEGEFHE